MANALLIYALILLGSGQGSDPLSRCRAWIKALDAIQPVRGIQARESLRKFDLEIGTYLSRSRGLDLRRLLVLDGFEIPHNFNKMLHSQRDPILSFESRNVDLFFLGKTFESHPNRGSVFPLDADRLGIALRNLAFPGKENDSKREFRRTPFEEMAFVYQHERIHVLQTSRLAWGSFAYQYLSLWEGRQRLSDSDRERLNVSDDQWLSWKQRAVASKFLFELQAHAWRPGGYLRDPDGVFQVWNQILDGDRRPTLVTSFQTLLQRHSRKIQPYSELLDPSLARSVLEWLP